MKTNKKDIHYFTFTRFADGINSKIWTVMSATVGNEAYGKANVNLMPFVFIDIRSVIVEWVRDNTTRPLKYRYKY
jgi:hypothetical protein